ncbi:inositol oxygenase-like isoform X2 [Lissotriton helveticus]
MLHTPCIQVVLSFQSLYPLTPHLPRHQDSSSMKIIMGPDPSLVYRPDIDPDDVTDKEKYRNYTNGPLQERVLNTYTLMHTYQSVEFVKHKNAKWCSFNHKQMSIMEALNMLDDLVDESDPDVDFPNSYHAYQTAEGIRKKHSDKGWFQLVGLLHDIGKILSLYNEPQWCVVGDTFPVGCKFQDSIVFQDCTFEKNPDNKHSEYSTKYGTYTPQCGLDNVLMSWGHDEYMYKVLKFNNCSLPAEGFYMIRFHSFYPWHTGGDYMHLCDKKDLRMLPWVKFDLYTKTEDMPDVESLRPYYQSLIDKYCPGILSW